MFRGIKWKIANYRKYEKRRALQLNAIQIKKDWLYGKQCICWCLKSKLCMTYHFTSLNYQTIFISLIHKAYFSCCHVWLQYKRNVKKLLNAKLVVNTYNYCNTYFLFQDWRRCILKGGRMYWTYHIKCTKYWKFLIIYGCINRNKHLKNNHVSPLLMVSKTLGLEGNNKLFLELLTSSCYVIFNVLI